jgi:hypothetical protein
MLPSFEMATKAERFKAETQRSGKKKAAAPKRRVTTESPPEKKAGRRTNDADHTASRTVSKHAAGKAEVALEDSKSGQPSRKSTRSSANRSKPASNLQRRTTRKARSPEKRAEKSMAKAQRGKKTPAKR